MIVNNKEFVYTKNRKNPNKSTCNTRMYVISLGRFPSPITSSYSLVPYMKR